MKQFKIVLTVLLLSFLTVSAVAQSNSTSRQLSIGQQVSKSAKLAYNVSRFSLKGRLQWLGSQVKLWSRTKKMRRGLA